PPRLTVGARSRRETQLAQRAKNLVERVLQGKFVATQNQHCNERKCQDTVTSKSRRCCAIFLTCLFRSEIVPQRRKELEFVFLFTRSFLLSSPPYFQRFTVNLIALALKSRAKITWSLRDQENYIGCAFIVPALKSQGVSSPYRCGVWVNGCCIYSTCASASSRLRWRG